MIRTLKLKNFRCFEDYELQNLGRVNLLVGTNNSGKTSILEAIRLLKSPRENHDLLEILDDRGLAGFSHEEPVYEARYDPTWLFYNREYVGKSIFIESNTSLEDRVEILFYYARGKGDNSLSSIALSENDIDIFHSEYVSQSYKHSYSKRANSAGVFGFEKRKIQNRLRPVGDISPLNFVATGLLNEFQIGSLFDDTVLSEMENVAIDSLCMIDPEISRIAATTERGIHDMNTPRRIFYIKRNGVSNRMPIGVMGDGIYRLLGLSLALANSVGGILLVDEIDTGLHYSVMEKMWKLVTETAKKHDIQVFATTHSRDCVESLASVCRENVGVGSEVTIQRIEQGKKQAVSYTEQQIITIADRGIEVR
jgi:ABC-type branched-subunit amino acid transport system ATPase component